MDTPLSFTTCALDNHCLENYVKEFLEHRMMSVVPAVFVLGNNNPELPR